MLDASSDDSDQVSKTFDVVTAIIIDFPLEHSTHIRFYFLWISGISGWLHCRCTELWIWGW